MTAPDPTNGPVTCWHQEPPQLQAWQVTSTNRAEIARWCDIEDPDDLDLIAGRDIPDGNYVMRGITGEFFLVTPEQFATTYTVISVVQEVPGDSTNNQRV